MRTQALFKMLNTILVVFGVIFLILLIAGAYIVIVDPFGLRPPFNMIRGTSSSALPVAESTIENENIGQAPALEGGESALHETSEILPPAGSADPNLLPSPE